MKVLELKRKIYILNIKLYYLRCNTFLNKDFEMKKLKTKYIAFFFGSHRPINIFALIVIRRHFHLFRLFSGIYDLNEIKYNF